MNVKLDTKDQFKVLTLQTDAITATMTEELEQLLQQHSKTDIPHIIVNLYEVEEIDPEVADTFAMVQQNFYENSLSLVICNMKPDVLQVFREEDLFDALNYTPTLSEAFDIIQMEAIERELMNGFE
jgi:anti-anti-sigma regulatory factor